MTHNPLLPFVITLWKIEPPFLPRPLPPSLLWVSATLATQTPARIEGLWELQHESHCDDIFPETCCFLTAVPHRSAVARSNPRYTNRQHVPTLQKVQETEWWWFRVSDVRRGNTDVPLSSVSTSLSDAKYFLCVILECLQCMLQRCLYWSGN